jgi:hypothetical protein
MENNLKYSIIYAVIRPEIAEKLSLGILTIEDEKVNVHYSQKKLYVLKMLYTPKEYEAVSRMVRQELRKLNPQTLTYLTRYSNNLIAFSQIQNIDNTQSNINSDWLYKNYVYNS